jgi:hypothetical protein
VVCRIETRRADSTVVVRLIGRLSQAQVPDLLAVCGQAIDPIVEVDELVSADIVGLDALARIEERGGRLVGLSQYLRLKLEAVARDRQ